MKPIIILLFLGAVILVNASYRATESPEQFRRRLMQTPAPTAPSWAKKPWIQSSLPPGYSLTEADIREKEQKYREMQKKLRGVKRSIAEDENEEIELEKRRNLLVGRYGFRIGKRDVNDELTEDDYEELVAEGERDPSKAFVQ